MAMNYHFNATDKDLFVNNFTLRKESSECLSLITHGNLVRKMSHQSVKLHKWLEVDFRCK